MFLARRIALSTFLLIALPFALSGTSIQAQTNAPVAVSRHAARDSAFLEQIDANFAKWDRDHNGELSRGEIDRATTDPTITGKSAAALVALKRAIGSKTYTVKPLTRESIAQYVATAQENRKTQPDFEALYKAALTRISHITRDLFASGTPKLEMLHQGRMGDCFALAPLGAMIHRDPQEVVRMFQTKPDGTVQVAFGNATPITITPLTDAEIVLSASARQDGVWVNLYEKAVGEQKLESQSASKSASKTTTGTTSGATNGTATNTATSTAASATSEDDAPSPLDAIAHGGSAGKIISVITGHRIKRISCTPWHLIIAKIDPKPDAKTDTKTDATEPVTAKTDPTKTDTKPDTAPGTTPTNATPRPASIPNVTRSAASKETDETRAQKLANLRALLTSSVHEKHLICAGTPTTVSVPGISPKHAYAILDYDAAQDTLLIWNPHGNTFHPKGTPGLDNGYSTTAGQFTVPLKEAVTFFSGFSFETDMSAH